MCVAARVRQCAFGRTHPNAHTHSHVSCLHPTWIRDELLAIGVDCVWFGSQAFGSATAFNQNIAFWNVLRVTNFTDMTGASALSDCNQKAMYTAWGSTFQAAWPAFNVATCTVGSICAMCITNSNIGAAVTAWATSPTTATTTYGNIADWNTAAVTSMASLFANKPTLNADISKWNVASVANMGEVCANKIEHQFAI
jgi:surface protein